MDPLRMAAYLLDQGAPQIALVDVDAAHGTGNNRDVIARILQLCHLRMRRPCIQVAGGIRSSDQAQFFLDHGASWLVVGTILHKSSLVVEQLVARFQPHLIAAIDARGGQVHCSGWASPAGVPAEELARRAQGYGFRRLLFVDIPDHPEAEPDYDTARRLLQASRLPLVMGGSLTSRDHLLQARSLHALHGALVDALLFPDDPLLLELLQPACA